MYQTDRRPCAVTVGLWQRYLGWPPSLPGQPSSVHSQRCSSVGHRSSSRGSYYRHSPVFSGSDHQSELNIKLAVIVYQCLHGTAPQYLSDTLQYVADMPTRGRLHSLTSGHLNVCQSRLVTVGDRSFITAAPRFWNSLLRDVQSAFSLTAFRRKLKAHLFQQSCPDIILQ